MIGRGNFQKLPRFSHGINQGVESLSGNASLTKASSPCSTWERGSLAVRALSVGAGLLIAAYCLFAHGCHGTADTELLLPLIEESSSATAAD